MKVYTWKPEPFMHGGTGRFVATNIEEYERVDIGLGYYGIVFRNPVHKQWHLALEDCGALIGSGAAKAGAVKSVKKDVETGDPELMKKQIAQGRKDRDNADVLDPKEFFGLLKGD